MTVLIYHNPRCSKSRETLKLLNERGVEPEIVEYLKDPPSVEDLRRIVGLLGIAPRDLMRKKEAREASLDGPDLSDEDILLGMAANPSVIERPIVVHGDRARLGRPPEAVLDIL